MRIGIVNDSNMALEALRRTISSMPGHDVAWLARDGMEAISKSSDDTPDLILMDLIMPGIDGVEATRRIMQQSPCAILVVTASVETNLALTFEALSAGALDAIKTPEESDTDRALKKKITDISKILGKHEAIPKISGPANSLHGNRNNVLIGIGASTGGPAAVVEVLSALRASFAAAIVVVVHIDKEFAPGMAEWMNDMVELPVRLVVEGEHPSPGEVLLAATNEHLILTHEQALRYTPEPRHTPYRPSVDTFFSSMAKHWRGEAAAVLLTGMGKDGAEGLKAVRDHGWHTIAQDERSSVVYGMPKAAAGIGAASEILPLNKIGPALIRFIEKEHRHISSIGGGQHVSR